MDDKATAAVLHRLSDYQRRGWISQIDAAQYRSVMNQRRNDPVTLRQISTRLDEIARRGAGGILASHSIGSSALAGNNNNNNNKASTAAVASPTYTASSTTTSSSSTMSGVTSSGSLASTTDPNAASENDDDEEEVVVTAPPTSKPSTLLLTKTRGNKAEAPPPAESSSLSTPYLRSLQCISNVADANPSKGKGGHHAKGSSHHVTWKDDDGGNVVKKGINEKDGNAQLLAGSIVEPSQLWKARSDSLDPASLQELFVEMCFYARLGFVQPPCCLKCTYRTAHPTKTKISTNNSNKQEEDGSKSSSPSSACQQFVVWRKNASAVLHPGTLGTNIVLVPCSDAQKLLDGQVVSGYYWDAAKKRLQVTSPSKKAAAGAAAAAASSSSAAAPASKA
jgi:hypothetical protein